MPSEIVLPDTSLSYVSLLTSGSMSLWFSRLERGSTKPKVVSLTLILVKMRGFDTFCYIVTAADDSAVLFGCWWTLVKSKFL